SVVLSTINNEWTESIARAVASKMGGMALMALYTMDGKTAKRATLPAMLSLTMKIVKTLRIARQQKLDILSELLKVTQGVRLFKGKIVDLDRRTDKGHVRGVAIIQGSDDFGGQKLNMQFQNENLVARTGEKVLATVPDLITIVDQDTCFPITTEGLKYGLRVTVIGIPCHKKWRTPAGIALAGPHHFGYDIPYKPIAVRGGTRRSHAASARN